MKQVMATVNPDKLTMRYALFLIRFLQANFICVFSIVSSLIVLSHSSFKAVIGFIVAALKLFQPTVTKAMIKVISAAIAITVQSISIR